jgi:cytochrome P450
MSYRAPADERDAMATIDQAIFKAFQLATSFLDRTVTGNGVRRDGLTDDPFPEYKRILGKGPVVRSYSTGGWFVLGYEAVSDAMKDPRFGVDPRKSPFVRRLIRRISKGEKIRFIEQPTMLNLDPPDHTRLRKLARQGFLHKYVQSLESNIRELVDECLAAVQERGTFDVMETLAAPLPAFLISDILGVPREGRQKFQRWSEYIAKYARTFEYEALTNTNKIYNEMMDYLAGVVEEKRANPGHDLISQFIAAEEEGDKLTAEEIYSTSGLLLIAGHETTTRLIGNALWLLLTHPDQLQQLRDDPDLIPNAVEEALRFQSPVQHTSRVALEDIEFYGKKIRKHQLLELIIGAANRDPAANDDPDRFDVRRENVQHVGFGYGIHLCLGADLARLEAKTVLEMLLDRYPDMSLENPVPAWGDSDFVRGLDELIVSV